MAALPPTLAHAMPRSWSWGPIIYMLATKQVNRSKRKCGFAQETYLPRAV